MTTLTWLGVGGGGLAILQFLWTVYKDVKGGGIRKLNAEAAKEAMDAESAAASMPHLQESIRLGNWAEAMALQQSHINGLQAQLSSSAERERLKDQRIDELETRVRDRDKRIDELELRLGHAEDHLTEARNIINDLRNAPDHTNPAP